jgi:hypothetical protein
VGGHEAIFPLSATTVHVKSTEMKMVLAKTTFMSFVKKLSNKIHSGVE